MMVGGSTTSLLSLLHEIDHSKYNVDLIMDSREGKLDNLIPSSVNVLPNYIPYSLLELKKRKKCSLRSMSRRILGLFYDFLYQNTNAHSMLMQEDTLRFCENIDKEYDVAISFLEGLPLYFLSKKVHAKKKIAWIHVDYIEAKFKKSIDKKYLSNIDNIVLVSDSCRKSFNICFPEFEDKTIVVENILSSKFVIDRSNEFEEPVSDNAHLKFISTCRVSLHHKGLDRGVKAIARLKNEGYDISNWKWYIVGTGSKNDLSIMNNLINNNNLSSVIEMCGEKINPLPFEKECDIFFLPSHYEGKPMAVTEAQMLGLMPLVTRYSSAIEQIEHGIDGCIMDNNDDAIYLFLKKILLAEIDVIKIRKNIRKRDYSNKEEINKIYQLFSC